jgi:hypothetical protein
MGSRLRLTGHAAAALRVTDQATGRREWPHRAGVWQQLHHTLLDQLGREGKLDWSRASLDSVSARAKRGAN